MPDPAVFFRGHGLGNDYVATGAGCRLPFGLTAAGGASSSATGTRGDGQRRHPGAVPSRRGRFRAAHLQPRREGGREERQRDPHLRRSTCCDLGLRRGRPRRSPSRRRAAPWRGDPMGETSEGRARHVEVEMGTASFRSVRRWGLAGPDREDRTASRWSFLGRPRWWINTWSASATRTAWSSSRRVGRGGAAGCLRPADQHAPGSRCGTNVRVASWATAPGEVEAWGCGSAGPARRCAGDPALCAVARRPPCAAGWVSERQGGGAHARRQRCTWRCGDDWSLVLRGPVEGVYRGELTTGMVARLQVLG